jgi:hypothetical protein
MSKLFRKNLSGIYLLKIKYIYFKEDIKNFFDTLSQLKVQSTFHYKTFIFDPLLSLIFGEDYSYVLSDLKAAAYRTGIVFFFLYSKFRKFV